MHYELLIIEWTFIIRPFLNFDYFLCSFINTTLSDKDKSEHETWDLSKEKKNSREKRNNVVIQGSSAELVKKK